MSRQELRSTSRNCQVDDRQESCSSAGNCQADEQTVITQLSRPCAAPAPAPAAAAPAAAPAGVSNGRYGPVQSGQTLSGIARDLTPAGVDLQQMMLALQHANPDAFYRDNINALKRGAVLRVPTST